MKLLLDSLEKQRESTDFLGAVQGWRENQVQPERPAQPRYRSRRGTGHQSNQALIMVTVRFRRNGPCIVEGEDVRILDWNGVEYRIARRPVALCRCGASRTKPFCDGTHSKIDFQAAEAAVSDSGDKPAD